MRGPRAMRLPAACVRGTGFATAKDEENHASALSVSADPATRVRARIVDIDCDRGHPVPHCCIRVLFLRTLSGGNPAYTPTADERAFTPVPVNERSGRPRRVESRKSPSLLHADGFAR